MTLGSSSLVVVTKAEVKGYNYQGEVLWRYSPLPKAFESRVIWVPNKNIYLWIVSNNLETIVAAIHENGNVLKVIRLTRIVTIILYWSILKRVVL